MGLITELRRRNVFRMAALYVVAAWLVMQVAEVLIGLGVLPESTGLWVMVVLAIGLPIALFVSWFFEITPEGVSLEKDVPEGQSNVRAASRRTDFIIIAILSAALIMFAYDKWSPQGPPDLSIAVLPFENMSDDPSQAYFSDGISEEILNLLAQIKPLKVIARTSSFSFRGKDTDIATMAQQLNVRHILEGSVRRSGDRVRITAQLIDAKDSSQLWSQTFDRDYSAEDLFYIQSEIARTITGRLRMTLTASDETRLARIPTDNTEAYTAYLLGRDRLRDRKVAGLADAVDRFANAIQLDPDFAGAWSGLYDACYLYTGYSGGHVRDGCQATDNDSYVRDLEALARKAVELDPELGEAWISLGSALENQVDGSPESMPLLREAHAAYERGLELNPNHSQGYHWYSLSLRYENLYPNPPFGYIDAWKRGVWRSVIDKGLEVDPLSVPLHRAVSLDAGYSPDEVMWHARRLIEIAPDSPLSYARLGYLSGDFEGRMDEAIKWFSKAYDLDPENHLYDLNGPYFVLGDYDSALQFNNYARSILTHPPAYQYIHRALALSYLGRRAEAAEAAEAVEALEQIAASDAYGDYPRLNALILLAGLDLAGGDEDAAVQRFESWLNRCLESDNKADDCPIVLLRIFQLAGREDEVREIFEGNYEKYVLPFIEYEDNPSQPGSFRPFSNIYYLTLFGQLDEALDALEALSPAERTSYIWQVHRDYHPALDAIRAHPRFRAVFAEIEAEMAKQLENVRAMERRGEIPSVEELLASRKDAQK